jgi:hypothetical protein
MRLVDRHLRILVAMNHQQRRIVAVNMSHWAGKLCKLWLIARLSTQQ